MNNPGANPDETELVPAVLRAQEAAGNAFENTGVQLSRLIWMLEDPAEPLAAEKAAEEWHAEVFRRLLAFLNAAHDLLVYTKQMAQLSGGAHTVPGSLPLNSFLEEIRTCMQHRASPAMRLTHFEPPAPKLRVLHMDISPMLPWPHWSASARQYLHQQQPNVAVAGAVHEYLQSVRMFRLRALREFRAKFAEILASVPPQMPMMMIPGM